MFYGYKDKSVRVTGRWADFDNGYVATATGSKIEIAFKGDMAVLHFNTDGMPQPFLHLWISVDGGDRFEAPIEKYLRVSCNENAYHIITVIFKGSVEVFKRWEQPLEGRVHFLGYEAQESGILKENAKKTVEFIGDSITEGVLIDESYAPDKENGQNNRVYQDDVCATYAYKTAQALDLEPIFMGYGATGVTKSGCGGVPPTYKAYPYCFSGAPITHNPADYIVINIGTNDRPNPNAFCENYKKLLDTVISRNKKSKIFILVPFIGCFKEELTQIGKEYGIPVIDTSGIIPETPLHPDRNSHNKIAEYLIAELKALIIG